MTTQTRENALKQLMSALTEFLDSGLQSEGSANPGPYAGMDPDELDVESVEPGGDIHNAVCEVQLHYGGRLPSPVARNPWRLLQWICRHEEDPFVRQNDAHTHAASLSDWVQHEIGNLTPQEMTPRIKILRRVNSGLFGVIWEGEQIDLRRRVAVKIINESMAILADAQDHARALAKVPHHPNIVSVYCIEQVRLPDIEGLFEALVMEWIDGVTLDQRLTRPVSKSECLGLSNDILSGLSHLHSNGITHGDLHAGNVLVTNGRAKIIDLAASSGKSLTRLARLSSRDGRLASDIESAAFLLRRLLNKSKFPVRDYERIELQIRESTSIAEMQRAILEGEQLSQNSARSEPHESTQLGMLTSIAREILLTAYEGAGEIIVGEADSGFYVLVPGGKNFSRESAREQAELRHAVQELIKAGFLEQVRDKLHRVSLKGFKACDQRQ